VTASVTVVSCQPYLYYTVSGSPATPATGTPVATRGGVTQYSYRIEAFNATGNNVTCARVSISNGIKDLNSLNYK